MRIDARMFAIIPKGLRDSLMRLPPVKSIVESVLGDLGIPRATLKFFNYPTRFDNRDAEMALAGSGITCPPLESYAGFLWDYWERHLEGLSKARPFSSPAPRPASATPQP